MQALKDAKPADKAEVYRRIGLTLTYHPQEKRVAAEARPNSIMYVGACPRTDTHLNYMIDIALTTEFSIAHAARVPRPRAIAAGFRPG
jgi:hypothetical protein